MSVGQVIPKSPEEIKRELMSRFKTPVQIKALEGGEPPKFLIEGILPENALVTFQGAAKSGKSTFLFHMIKAMLNAEKFCDRATIKTPVIYFSEQSRSTLRDQLEKAGLGDIPADLHFCTSEDNWNLGWQEAFRLGGAMSEEMKAKLLVYDSWGRFARFDRDENEMAPSATQERVTLLRGIQSTQKLTILLNQHTSKGSKGAGIVSAGLGSSALAQQVDLLLSLSGEPRVPDIGEDQLVNLNCRAIQGLGRFAPLKMAVELKDGIYVPSTFKKGRGNGDGGTVDEAEQVLEILFSDTTAIDAKVAWDMANSRGIGERALKAARANLGVTCKKSGKGWTWHKPVDPIWKSPEVVQ
jgi:AAA domain